MRTFPRAAGWIAAAAALAGTAPAQQPVFDPLFRVTNVNGACEVRKPDATVFEPVVPNKAYPFGTVVRTGQKDSEAVVRLNLQDGLRLQAQTEVTVLAPEASPADRVVRLANGRVRTSVREGVPEKAVTIETAVASLDALTGHSLLACSRDASGVALDVTVEDGGLRVTGPQFAVPKIKAGCSLRVLTAEDRSLSRLTDVAGDYTIQLENGTETPVNFEATTRSTVRIWREHAPVGGRLVVSVFAAGPDGKNGQNFAYTVGRSLFVASEMPASPADTGATGAVATAAASAATNAPAVRDDSLWK